MRMDGPVVLSIAGYDPSSGAGVTADIKTIAAFGCYGLTCITAVTVQNTMGVRQVEPLLPELVSDTLFELAADFDIAAVRIGMLGSGKAAEAVAAFLETVGQTPDAKGTKPVVVLDPILRSSSGAELLDAAGADIMRSRLIPLSTVVTPNIDETEALTGLPARTDEERRRAGERLLEMGAGAAVITGGHLERPVDLLVWSDGGKLRSEVIGTDEKVESASTHGTGCAFATAVACGLTSGQTLPVVVGFAKAYVTEAIRRAAPLGHGHGPMNLLWNL